MAENSYFNAYSNVEAGMMGHVEHYRGPSDESYDDASGENKYMPGFYTEHYHNVHHQRVHAPKVESMSTMHSNHGNQDYNSSMGSLGVSSSHVAGLYEQPINMNNYNNPVKHESRQGMPPTPPGSPDDEAPEDMSVNASAAASLMAVNATSVAAQHLLAKPVPMRRPSEKRIAQARASMNNVPPIQNVQDQQIDIAHHGPSPAVAHALSVSRQAPRRPRSEKKAIPAEMKDDRYFERRKRNNNAAKKSRDCRKAREDEIAIRASFLEKENAVLRAQVVTLREEANSLRHLLMQKRSHQS